MRNLATLFIVTSVMLLFGGCLSTDNPPTTVTFLARTLHSEVSQTNRVALDPTNIAFRLNTLLSEAVKEVNADVALEEIVVSVDGVEQPLQYLLFGEATVEQLDAEGLAYRIVYPSTTKPMEDIHKDVSRQGEIVVETKGKLLSELYGLQVGENSWVVYTESEVPYRYGSSYAAGNSSDGRSTALVYLTPYGGKENLYTIEGISKTTWSVKTGEFRATLGGVDSDNAANWNAHYTVTHKEAPIDPGLDLGERVKLDFIDVTSATFNIGGEASGTVLNPYRGLEFDYEISAPLIYRSRCNLSTAITLGGEEKIVVTTSEIGEDLLPSRDIRVRWSTVSSNGSGKPTPMRDESCNNRYMLWYNGYLYDSHTGREEPDVVEQ